MSNLYLDSFNKKNLIYAFFYAFFYDVVTLVLVGVEKCSAPIWKAEGVQIDSLSMGHHRGSCREGVKKV